MRADACAHSDSCSIDDAEHFIAEILTLQSDCLSGSLSDDEVCEDVTFPAEVIASLREKIAKETSKSTFNLTPVVASLGAAYLVAGAYTMLNNPGVEVFTPQEWFWAIRD
eukprot:1035210_1